MSLGLFFNCANKSSFGTLRRSYYTTSNIFRQSRVLFYPRPGSLKDKVKVEEGEIRDAEWRPTEEMINEAKKRKRDLLTNQIIPDKNLDKEDKARLMSEWRKMAYRLQTKDGNFVDWKRVQVVGGCGGGGCFSLGEHNRSGETRPTGGNGGMGGNIYLVSDPRITSLKPISKNIIADSGKNGGSNHSRGANGTDLYVKIPVGCVVRVERDVIKQSGDEEEEELFESDSLESLNENPDLLQLKETYGVNSLLEIPLNQVDEKTRTLLMDSIAKLSAYKRYKEDPLVEEFDFDEPGIKLLVARGGYGGTGNSILNTRENGFFKAGEPGEIRNLSIELKTVADVGLVGLPNAGKSSFLASVSRAHPRIAPFPFTTLNPYVGTIDFAQGECNQLKIADIPGIIMGAHLNYGLGFTFLRHIERSHILTFVIDASKPKCHLDYYTLLRELELYKAELVTRPSLIVANKIDRFESKEEADAVIEDLKSKIPQALADRVQVIPVSSKFGFNVQTVTFKLKEMVEELLRKKKEEKKNASPVGEEEEGEKLNQSTTSQAYLDKDDDSEKISKTDKMNKAHLKNSKCIQNDIRRKLVKGKKKYSKSYRKLLKKQKLLQKAKDAAGEDEDDDEDDDDEYEDDEDEDEELVSK